MLGVGLAGELRKPYPEYIQVIMEAKAIVVSADAPTGLGTASFLKPDHTVTFHDTKTGMNFENSGNIVVIPIGIPVEAGLFIGPGELVSFYPHPSKPSHKGQNGRLLIVGGGPYTGAPALAGLAALRTGVDLVHIATPKTCKNTISSYSPNFIVHGLEGSDGDFIVPEDLFKILELCTRTDACVLGPGLGRDPLTLTFVRDLLERCPIPVILDADGLAALESSRFGPDAVDKETNKPKSGWIITPHFNEFKRIMEQILNASSVQPVYDASQSPELGKQCKSLSWALGTVVVLKGGIDIVCESDKLKYNRTGNPGMTVGGTGDVLTGIIGALAAKNLDLYNCGRLGVFLNGSAGDLAWSDLGPGLTATDIIDYIPKVLTKFITF
jgi:NAD(P)H-hydrate epimerase